MRAFGDEVRVLLGAGQTGGKLSLWTETVPPGGGPPPHRHLREDEWFVVQEGTFSFFGGGQWCELGVGGTAFMPRESVHTFKNTGSTPGKLLIGTSPAGFEMFFGRCAEEFAREGGPDMGRIIAIAGEHGIEFEPPA